MQPASPAPLWLFPSGERLVFTKLLTVYAAAAVIALVGWVLNVGQLYWMAAALGLLPTAGRIVARLEQRGVDVTRHLPSSGHQGETVTVRLQVRNATGLPKLHLSLLDRPPRGLSPLDDQPLPVHLPPRGADTAEYSLRLGRRGYHTLENLLLLTTDPLGLAQRSARVTLASRILVYPRVVPLPTQVLPPNIGGGSAPIDAAGRKGEGAGFFGIREYRPGDPLRHVHWRTAARLGRLAVVEWEAEESREALLVVETAAAADRDLGPGTTLDLAAGLAASLGAHLLTQHHSVRLLAPGTAEGAADRAGLNLPDLIEGLARAAPLEGGGPAAPAHLRRALPHLRPGTLVCLFTSLVGPETLDVCRLLRAAGFPIAVYLLPGDAGPGAGVAALQGMECAAVVLRRDDELVRRLLC